MLRILRAGSATAPNTAPDPAPDPAPGPHFGVADAGPPAEAGRRQRAFAARLAALIDSNPAVRDIAVEVGVVDRRWLDEPSRHRPRVAPPVEVLRRVVERIVERHPSVLGGLGLSALQVLAWDLFWDRGLPIRSRDTVSEAAVVFTDLEGFTRFTAEHGDEAALALLAEHHRLAAPVVRQWGGRIVKHLGDGLMIVFPHPAAAVHAAVELLPTAPAPLRLRAGVHAGEVVVTADDLIGHVVNVAARVTDVARGGQVLVTVSTLESAGELGGVRALRPRRRALKGITERVAISRVERVEREDRLDRPARPVEPELAGR